MGVAIIFIMVKIMSLAGKNIGYKVKREAVTSLYHTSLRLLLNVKVLVVSQDPRSL